MYCAILEDLLISILTSQMTDTVYYPPSESEGGWRSLISPNDAPTAEEKQKIIQTTGLDWDELHEAWRYCESFDGPHSLLVIRHGWIAGEWYNFTEPKGIASCTKSLTGLAMAKLLDLSDAGKLTKHKGRIIYVATDFSRDDALYRQYVYWDNRF